VIGHPVQKLIDYAKEQSIDLIVMATHGRSGIEHALLGGTTEKIVRNSPCSVLVIRARQQ
jgi:universal stress protein A